MDHQIGNHRSIVRSLTTALLIFAVSPITFSPFHDSSARAQTKLVSAGASAPTGDEVRPAPDGNVHSASATAADGGILVQWRTDPEPDNRGFFVYRLLDRQMTLAARIVEPASSERLNSYQWFDPSGTADCNYYIASIGANRRKKVYEALVPVSRLGKPASSNVSRSRTEGGSVARVDEYPTLAGTQAQLLNGPIDVQWGIAAQTALKIQVKSNDWYRVTQQQMSAAGFNPTADIRNLSLFVSGQEIAIQTSKGAGQLIPGDYIEFYGQGLDTLDTDARIYYLIAGTTPGKRVQGDLHIDSSAPPSQLPLQQTRPLDFDFNYRGWFAPLVTIVTGEKTSSAHSEVVKPAARQSNPNLTEASLGPIVSQSPAGVTPSSITQGEESKRPDAVKPAHAGPITSVLRAESPVPEFDRKSKRRNRSYRRKSRRTVRLSKPRYSHALDQTAGTVLSFNYSVRIRERFNYNTQLPVGHNFFGSAIGSGAALTKTLTIHNLEPSADGPARLEVALQGISNQAHQVNIFCNNLLVGTMTNFSGHDNSVQTFSIPVSQLVEGDNNIKIAPVPTGEFVGLDQVTLTYPHSYRAYNDALRFSLRSTQSLTVDGFSTPNVRLVDISDPTNVKVTRPIVASSGGSYAITVPAGPRVKAGRTMYALPEGQFQTPAGFSLNQPSTLNASGNGADLLIISHKDFIPKLAPLVLQRQSQGLAVLVADVDDVYDEFSFGAHSSQALQDFLSYAYTPGHWAKAPRYVLLMGDASYDPRGNFATAVTRSQIRQHDSQHPGCADLGDNARDFSMALFPLPRNLNFNSTPCSDASGVVISEIYDGGGDPANTYANGYVELFNRGPSPVNVNGWSVQYANGTDWQVTSLTNVTIDPGHYYLVQEAGLGGFYPLLPAPDAIGNILINRNQGKVALVNSTAPLAGACPVGGGIVDFVGYGSSVNCFQGSGPTAVSVDFVPTKQVDTTFGAACSDDSLADFNGDGVPEIPIGRLPARTLAEADLMVSKIVSFSKANVPQTALFVADAQGNYYWNFESHSDDLANLVPQSIPTQKIYLASQPSPAACEANIINSINQGVALVNYQGHGNVNVWSGASIFTNGDAHALTNGNRLPLVIVADCLNGLFDDPVLEGLAETLLKAPNGGAVATYASSGDTIPDGQQEMSVRVYQLLFGAQSMALGDVTKQAKTATNDLDVRRTWILLGDPSMKIW
jgi:Peptidase family C25/Lamin Tail Domain